MVKFFSDQRVVDFAAYIDGNRNESGTVHMNDIDLMAIYHLAPHVVLFDVIQPDSLKVRFVGTALTVAYKRDVTGLIFDELDLGVHTNELRESYNQLLATAKPRWTYTKIDTMSELKGLDRHLQYAYERVSYPLLNDDGQIGRVISILAVVPMSEAKSDFEDVEIA